MRILTVCIGNICRSPVAERLLQVRLDAAVGADVVTVSSAGIGTRGGREMDPLAVEQLIRLGGDPAGFVSRAITPPMVLEADLVLVLTKDIRTEVLQMQPRVMRRTFTLAEFAALVRDQAPVRDVGPMITDAAGRRGSVAGEEQDVRDPIGRSVEVHRAVAEQISAYVDDVVAALAG